MQTHGRRVEAQREHDSQDPGVQGEEMDRRAPDVGDGHVRAAASRGNRDAAHFFRLGQRGYGRVAEQGRRDA